MLLLLRICKILLEVGWLALVGQGVMFLLAGRGRENNFVYLLFRTVTTPLARVARWITPRFVADAHIGLIAFLLVSGLWVLTTAGIVHMVRPNVVYTDAVTLVLLLIVSTVSGVFGSIRSVFGLG
jgi:hypothetical protein